MVAVRAHVDGMLRLYAPAAVRPALPHRTGLLGNARDERNAMVAVMGVADATYVMDTLVVTLVPPPMELGVRWDRMMQCDAMRCDAMYLDVDVNSVICMLCSD